MHKLATTSNKRKGEQEDPRRGGEGREDESQGAEEGSRDGDLPMAALCRQGPHHRTHHVPHEAEAVEDPGHGGRGRAEGQQQTRVHQAEARAHGGDQDLQSARR